MFGGNTVDNRNLQVTRKGPIAEADYRLVTVPAYAAEQLYGHLWAARGKHLQ